MTKLCNHLNQSDHQHMIPFPSWPIMESFSTIIHPNSLHIGIDCAHNKPSYLMLLTNIPSTYKLGEAFLTHPPSQSAGMTNQQVLGSCKNWPHTRTSIRHSISNATFTHKNLFFIFFFFFTHYFTIYHTSNILLFPSTH